MVRRESRESARELVWRREAVGGVEVEVGARWCCDVAEKNVRGEPHLAVVQVWREVLHYSATKGGRPEL